MSKRSPLDEDALEGLTCATCVGAVRRAVISLGPDSGLDVGSVDVRLLPNTTLTARYDGGRLGLDDAIARAIEDVGFSVTLTSRRDVSADDDQSQWLAEDGGPRGDSRTKKVLHLSLAAGKRELDLEHLRKFEGVSDAWRSRPRVARDNAGNNAPNRNCAKPKDPPKVFEVNDDLKPPAVLPTAPQSAGLNEINGMSEYELFRMRNIARNNANLQA
jgi:copper chaperone CopZ